MLVHAYGAGVFELQIGARTEHEHDRSPATCNLTARLTYRAHGQACLVADRGGLWHTRSPRVPQRWRPVIDRFSTRAGQMMVRDASHALPAAGAPIDFDRPPFITQGLGPEGGPVRYYNFDVQSSTPAQRFAFTRAGRRVRIPGQLDVVEVVPGDPGYSDFWQLTWVEVPNDFVAGSITSTAELALRGYPTERTSLALDCPVVPLGSTARLRIGNASPAPELLWFQDAQIACIAFGPPLALVDGHVPSSPIYVTFERDPGAPGGGADAGFAHEPSRSQTHNVVFSVPGDLDYSPLWAVKIYERAAFDRVHDADTAARARVLAEGPLVNCPIVAVSTR